MEVNRLEKGYCISGGMLDFHEPPQANVYSPLSHSSLVPPSVMNYLTLQWDMGTYCQRAKYGHKILLFSSSFTIHSLHFPFLMPLRLTLMIFLMLSLSLTIPEQEK